MYAALGTRDIPVTIDNVMHWQARADVAERFQQGRIFLAGDSAHVMPPNGGFGGNTGIQDAQNLAWKLAEVLRGESSPDLLATYDAERRPMAEFTVEQAYARYVTRTAPYLGTATLPPIAPDLDIELNYAYDHGRIRHIPHTDDLGNGWTTATIAGREMRVRPDGFAVHS